MVAWFGAGQYPLSVAARPASVVAKLLDCLVKRPREQVDGSVRMTMDQEMELMETVSW